MRADARKSIARPDERGFTLLEALIALAILSGVIITVISAANSQIKTATVLSEKARAAAVAREKLEEIRLTGLSPAQKENEAPEGEYRLRYRAEGGMYGLKRVCVEVSWDEKEHFDLCAHIAREKI